MRDRQSLAQQPKPVEQARLLVVMPRTTIPTVGALIQFKDPEGNVVGAMQYERKPMFR